MSKEVAGDKFVLFARVREQSQFKRKPWNQIAQEWVLSEHLDYRGDPEVEETCLCGHYPIKELFYFRNKFTEQEILVGNICVKKFFLMSCSNRILVDFIHTNRINKKTILLARTLHLINDWETTFMLKVWRKRTFSDNQSSKCDEIERKIRRGFELFSNKRELLERGVVDKYLRIIQNMYDNQPQPQPQHEYQEVY